MKKFVFTEISSFLDNQEDLQLAPRDYVQALNLFSDQDENPLHNMMVFNFDEVKAIVERFDNVRIGDCIFISRNTSSAELARLEGMTTFLFSEEDNKDFPTFDSWPEALLRIALMIKPGESKNLNSALSLLGQTQNIYDIRVQKYNPHSIQATGKLWTELDDTRLDDLSGINVKLSSKLIVEIPEFGAVKLHISKDSRSEDEAINYVHSLKAHGGIEDLNPSPLQSPTHVIEKDQKSGKRMLKRIGFR